jgi:hypothetical protein
MNITTLPYSIVSYSPEPNYISIYTTLLFYGYVMVFVRMCIHLFDEVEPFLADDDPPIPLQKYTDKYTKEYDRLSWHEISKDRLYSLENSIIIENTPVGSVLMFYKCDEFDKTGMFYYYSNNTIPYGLLEVVARKYVCTYDCKCLYIDSDISEPKKKIPVDVPRVNKGVFVTFKNYTSANTPNTPMNRFKSKGRIVNFNFLKKVDRKLVDANYSMTFSDYKRMASL